jgi:hypothetical protein
MNEVEYVMNNNIKIYTGSTTSTRKRNERNIAYFKELNKNNESIFSDPEPSTITTQGLMEPISFNEQEIFDMLEEPTGQIMIIGCNYGEKFNVNYVPPEVVVKSGRGRKAKPKIKNKRKVNGNGRYLNSQITFVIQHPKTKINYKIKLFRNGVFQVPGVKEPSMIDLLEPVEILRQYLEKNFLEKVRVLHFNAVMRNYKVKLLNTDMRVDLVYLEYIINFYKNYKIFKPFIDRELKGLRPVQAERAIKFVGKSNILNIAEINYNTDKYFCLNLKFYRTMPNDKDNKTTVKLLKKGKINFDGGNSELEMLELYYWLTFIYTKYASEILVNSTQIVNEYNRTKLVGMNVADFIYSDDESD